MLYPMNLNLAGRPCTVLGGGSVALRKVRALLAAEAEVTVISPVLHEELQELAESGRIHWQKGCYEAGKLPQSFLFICATDRPEINRQAVREARERNMLVNAPAQPELSDFTVPASFRRGNLMVTISTDGMSPACARQIRKHLEQEFPESFALWLERLHELRTEWRELLPESRDRENFWRKALDEEILALVRNGKLEQAEVRIKNAFDGNWSQS